MTHATLFLAIAPTGLPDRLDDPVTAVVLLVIGTLGGVACLAALLEYRRYGQELTAIGRAQRNLDQVLVERRMLRQGEDAGEEERPESTGAGMDEAASGMDREPVPIDPLAAGVWSLSLAHHRLESVRELLHRKVNIDAEVLQRLSLARDGSRLGLNLPHFAAGTCLLLGILGTFFGLATVVQGIQLGLPAETNSATVDSWFTAIRELRTVLGGMRTAFVTSLAGIAAAIVCSFLDFANRQRRRRVFERLDHFTVEELLPAVAPGTEDEALLQQVTRRLEASFERLDEIHRANEEVLKDLTGAQRAFAVIVDEMKRLTGSDARQDLREVIQHLDRTSRSMLALAERMPDVIRAVERGSGGLQRQVRVFLHRWFPVSLVLILVALVWALWISPG